MSFSELYLDDRIVARLTRMGYVDPTAIQAQAIPAILEGRDVIALASTGTGKTAAFLAPLVHRILTHPRAKQTNRDVSAVVLEPTRELAEQVAAEAVRIAPAGVKVACAFGGVGMQPQADAIAAGAHLLVATPGRLRELIDESILSPAMVTHLVIDEADRMMDMGFLPQVTAIVSAMTTSDRQTCLFSATMPATVERLSDSFLRKPLRIQVGVAARTVEHVRQRLFPVIDHLKTKLLIRLMEDDSRTGVLIFARTKRRVGWIAAALTRHGVRTGSIHGDRTQSQRRRALQRFKDGELGAIVATDVAARGLHIESVKTVVNYDLPVQPEEYLHRVGRAGHGGAIPGSGVAASGESITLLDPRDEDDWKAIKLAVHAKAAPERIDDFDYDERKRGGRESPGDARPRKQTASKNAKPKRATDRKSAAKEPPKVSSAPKRRHKQSRPIRGGDKPGGGIRKPRGS